MQTVKYLNQYMFHVSAAVSFGRIKDEKLSTGVFGSFLLQLLPSQKETVCSFLHTRWAREYVSMCVQICVRACMSLCLCFLYVFSYEEDMKSCCIPNFLRGIFPVGGKMK